MTSPVSKPPIIFLMGPTATGKTDLAAALLTRLAGEIISVDSALVYRGMDIGSAKPDAEFLARAPHHLLDIRDPAQPYSAADFYGDAVPLIEAIVSRGKVPILVGGTMLYFKVLLEGLADLPASDQALRDKILAEAEIHGWPEMHRRLAAVDPQTAAQLHPNHSQRIQRALEVYQLTGKPASQLKGEQHHAPGALASIAGDYSIVQIALKPHNRAFLHARIAARYRAMLELGLVEEVRSLRARTDLHRDLPSMRAVGYRQVWEYLDGELGYQEMIEKGIAATRQLAKRQLTWLRGWANAHELFIDDGRGVARSGDELLANCLKILQNSPIYKIVR